MATFPLDIRTELQLGGTWTDVSSDVYLRDVKQITRGVPDQGSAADPASLRLTLDNRSGKYSPRNAMSPLFGLLGRNTPLRLSLPSDGDHFLQMDGRTTDTVTTPHVAAFNSQDIDVRVECDPNWYGAGTRTLMGIWDTSVTQSQWILYVENGKIVFRRDPDGDSHSSYFYQADLPQLPDRAAIRATFDADDGNGKSVVTFYWADSLDATWNLIGSVAVADTSGVFYTSAPLQLGIYDTRFGLATPYRYPMNGRVYRAELRSSIGGTVVASPDFRAATPDAGTLVDSSARTWTLKGSAQIRNREDRFVGEVASWPLRWSTDDADRYAPITATGILRRLGQGAKALDSTLRRRIPSGSPVAYWPMEEQADAVQAYSPIAGVFPASVSSVEWASFNTLPSSGPLPRLTGTSSLSAPVPTATPGQWQVEFVYNADDNIPISEDVELVKFLGTGVVRRWQITLRNGHAGVKGYSSSNTLIVDQGIGVGADVFHGWTRLRFSATDDADGSGFTWKISWQDVGGDAGGFTGTYPTGTCGNLTMISADWPALTEGWGFGHLSVTRQVGSTLYDGSDDAYRGESAVERMRRLATEEGLSFTRTPGALPPAAVGFQRQDALVDLFEAAANADGGLFTEDMTRIGLHYRDRSSLYAQTPLFELSYLQPGLGPDLEPVDDDSDIVNDVTVTRDGGSSARAVLDVGSLSTQPAPEGIGKYDASHTLSLAEDNQAEPTAYWKLHLGTHDGARYPHVTLMLHKPGAEWLIPYVLRMREGDKIRITDLPEWVSHDDVELLVMGWSESLDLYSWELTLNCVPAGPWDTAVTDHPQFATVDTDGTVLTSAATSTATSLTVHTTAGPLWSERPDDLPYWIRSSGELMRVRSVGRMALPDNPFMDGGIANWVTDSTATIAYDTAFLYNYKATGSLKITPTAGVVTGAAKSTRSATGTVTGSTTYKAGMWVFSPTGHADIRATMNQFDAAGTFLSTAGLGSANPVPANVWTWVESTFTTDATASSGEFRARYGGTPGALPFYVWGARVFAPSGQSVSDTFTTRTSTSGWGVAESGQLWSNTGGSSTDYTVGSGVGRHVHNTVNVTRHTFVPAPSPDVDIYSDWTCSAAATGATNNVYVMARYTDTTHLYFAHVRLETSGGISLMLRKRNVAETQLGSTITTGITHSPGTQYTVRFQVIGNTLRAKVWLKAGTEPTAWQITATDTDLTVAGSVGFRSFLGSASTATLPVTISADNFTVTDSQTFTVDRSLNGVVKSQVVGTAVSIANPPITSL